MIVGEETIEAVENDDADSENAQQAGVAQRDAVRENRAEEKMLKFFLRDVNMSSQLDDEGWLYVEQVEDEEAMATAQSRLDWRSVVL